MSTFDFETFLRSPSGSSTLPSSPEPISTDHQEKLVELVSKFGADDYTLDGDRLSPWEMSFLVSRSSLGDPARGLARLMSKDRDHTDTSHPYLPLITTDSSLYSPVKVSFVSFAQTGSISTSVWNVSKSVSPGGERLGWTIWKDWRSGSKGR